MIFRKLRRAAALSGALAIIALRYCLIRARGPLSLEQRALWLHHACALVLRSLGIACRVAGRPPHRGIIVANHLSYLDILILSAATPCCFVAKSEINRWPYFGWAARAGGTLFVDRSSRAGVAQVAESIAERLQLSVPVLFFPEGTSTDGGTVLPFHASLFEPAVRAGAPVTPAARALRAGRRQPRARSVLVRRRRLSAPPRSHLGRCRLHRRDPFRRAGSLPRSPRRRPLCSRRNLCNARQRAHSPIISALPRGRLRVSTPRRGGIVLTNPNQIDKRERHPEKYAIILFFPVEIAGCSAASS